MDDPVIEELTSDVALREAYPVMEQLRPVGEEAFLRLVDEMRSAERYRLFAVRDGEHGSIRGLVGLAIGTNLYHGKHVFVYDLVVDEPHRGDGYGSWLLGWVEEWAEEHDCTRYELASGLWRDRAHEFYEANGMERYCYTFKKELSAATPY